MDLSSRVEALETALFGRTAPHTQEASLRETERELQRANYRILHLVRAFDELNARLQKTQMDVSMHLEAVDGSLTVTGTEEHVRAVLMARAAAGHLEAVEAALR
jgi:hypothetical protein